MNDVSPQSLGCCVTGIMSATSPQSQSLQPLFDAVLCAVDPVHARRHIVIVCWPTNSSRCINLWCGVVCCVCLVCFAVTGGSCGMHHGCGTAQVRPFHSQCCCSAMSLLVREPCLADATCCFSISVCFLTSISVHQVLLEFVMSTVAKMVCIAGLATEQGLLSRSWHSITSEVAIKAVVQICQRCQITLLEMCIYAMLQLLYNLPDVTSSPTRARASQHQQNSLKL